MKRRRSELPICGIIQEYKKVQKELHKKLEELRLKYEDNYSLNYKFMKEYKEKVKNHPLVEYWQLDLDEKQRLFQEYLKIRNKYSLNKVKNTGFCLYLFNLGWL